MDAASAATVIADVDGVAIARPRRAPLEVRLRVAPDQLAHVPEGRTAPEVLPPWAPLPQQGDVLYLAPGSAWGVVMLVHEWQPEGALLVEVWLEHVQTDRLAPQRARTH